MIQYMTKVHVLENHHHVCGGQWLLISQMIYRIQDLRRMNLNLYSIYVGETYMSELNFEKEFDLNSDKTELDFQGFSNKKADEKVISDEIVPVYDVILAGVK